MEIGSVSAKYSSTSWTDNQNQIKTLEKQKDALQKQITQLNQSNRETKDDEIKLLQAQIQQIEVQIQSIQNEKSKEVKDDQKAVDEVMISKEALTLFQQLEEEA